MQDNFEQICAYNELFNNLNFFSWLWYCKLSFSKEFSFLFEIDYQFSRHQNKYVIKKWGFQKNIPLCCRLRQDSVPEVEDNFGSLELWVWSPHSWVQTILRGHCKKMRGSISLVLHALGYAFNTHPWLGNHWFHGPSARYVVRRSLRKYTQVCEERSDGPRPEKLAVSFLKNIKVKNIYETK